MLDPTRYTALASLDFGSVYSPDGREHPVNAFTLPFLAQITNPANSQPTSSYATDPPSTYPAVGRNTPMQGSATTQATTNVPMVNADFSSIIKSVTPSHFGARFVVGVVAIVILAIVVARLLK